MSRKSRATETRRPAVCAAGRFQRFTRGQNLAASAYMEATTTMKSTAMESGPTAESACRPTSDRSSGSKATSYKRASSRPTFNDWPVPIYRTSKVTGATPEAVEPWPRADKHAVHKPVWPVVAIRRASVRIRRIVTICADWCRTEANPNPDSYAHLSAGGACHHSGESNENS